MKFQHRRIKEMETKELQNKLASIRSLIFTTQNNKEEAEKRKEKAEETLKRFQTEYEAAREKRQGLLASGKDVKKENESIKSMQTDKELAEDEVVGLDKMLIDLSDELQRLDKEEQQTEEDILKSKLLLFLPIYNKAAARLALIVREIWQLRLALNKHTYHSHAVYCPAGWDENALVEIPKLFSPDDSTVPRRDTVEAYHFRFRYFQYEAKEVPDLIDRDRLIKDAEALRVGK
jgi:hypothetical protein